MRKAFLAVVAGVAAAAFATSAAADDRAQTTAQAQAKVTICHSTGSMTNPYRRIVVSARAWANTKSRSGRLLRAHMRHAGDVVIMGQAACPPALLAGTGGTILRATLGSVGGAAGSGTAFLRIKGTQVCYVLKLSGTTVPLTAAHVHQTSTGGNIVIPLSVPENPNAAATGCTTVTQALVQSILANVADFYVNVHTTGGTVILTGTLRR